MVFVSNIQTELKKYKAQNDNTLWLLLDRSITILLNFFSVVVIARYLGPATFGVWSYVVSLVTIFTVASNIGLSGLVVRELVKNSDRSGEVLKTVFVLKLFASIFFALSLLIYASTFEEMQSIEYNLILILSAALIFNSFYVFDYWFQSRLEGVILPKINTQ